MCIRDRREESPLTSLTWRVLRDFTVQLADAETREPIETADLHLKLKGRGSRRLPESHFPGGLVHLDRGWLPAEASFKLTVQSPGYLDRTLTIQSPRPAEPLPLWLEAGPTVTVNVRDASGAPLPGAELRLGANGKADLDLRSETAHLRDLDPSTRHAVTDQEGRAILSTLNRGDGRPASGHLAVFADGYAPSWFEVDPSTTALEVTLSLGATLVIRAVDAEGRSLDGVIVEVERSDGSAWPMKASSTVKGLATFPHLAAVQHRYRTRVDGNAWRPHDYDPNASWASVELTDGMTTEAILETRGFFDVTGEITDHGVPLAGAHMALLPGAVSYTHLTLPTICSV